MSFGVQFLQSDCIYWNLTADLIYFLSLTAYACFLQNVRNLSWRMVSLADDLTDESTCLKK